MFSYVDKKIREKLKNDSRLININHLGQKATPECPSSRIISMLGPIPLPVSINNKEHLFNWYPFVRRVELEQVLNSAQKVTEDDKEAFRILLQERMSVNSVLTTPAFTKKEEPMVRIHSCCMTGDVFGSMRCECGPQLKQAFKLVAKNDGAIVYMSSHEGRGIGLWAKAVTYLLQDEGQDTYQANLSLGLPEDSRDFTDAAIVLLYLLGGKPIKLITNNPIKKTQVEEAGLTVSKLIPCVTGISKHNLRYMKSKKKKGHCIIDL